MGIWVVSTFWLLWIMLLWTFVPKFFFKHIFSFLWGYSPKIRIAGSYDNFMFPDYFQSGCVILHSHKQLLRILVSPYSCQHFLLSAVLIIAILMGMKWYLIIVLIFIFLMVNDVEHLFIGLLVICISSQEKCLVKPLAHFNQSICLFVVVVFTIDL